MYRLLIALSLIATLSHALPTNAVTRTATEAYVTNRLAAKLDIAATTNWTVSPHSDWITLADVPAQTNQQYVATAGTVIGQQSNTIATAWQNPPSKNWTWTSDGTQILITGYTDTTTEGHYVILPTALDGLPVTGWLGYPFTQIETFYSDQVLGYSSSLRFSGSTNLYAVSILAKATLASNCFSGCSKLEYVDLPFVKSLPTQAFMGCYLLSDVSGFKDITSIGDGCFRNCIGLTDLRFPNVVSVGPSAFSGCSNLVSITFSRDAPSQNSYVFNNIPANQVTIYVDNPIATGWGETWNEMPVVRLPVYGSGAGLSGITAEQVGAYSENNPSNYTTIAYVDSATNGLVRASITNGILSAAISADTTAKGVSANTATNAISATSPGTGRIRLTATALAATVPPASATYLAVQSESSVGTQSVVSVAIGTNLNYAAAFDATNTVLTEAGGQMINYILFLHETETGDQTARVEFFNHYTATNLWGSWGIIGPTFTVPSTATPSMVSGAVFVSAISTNAFSLGMRIRRVAGTAASSCLLKIGTGPGYDSRLSLSLPTYVHDADPAAHANMSRTSMLWTAAGTNATYQLSWDITNGTFRVLEILP